MTRQRGWLGWRPSRKDIERDVDEEVSLHLEMRTRDLERQGVEGRCARSEAERRFGDVKRYRNEMVHIKKAHIQRQERTRYWGEVRQDLEFGLRQLVTKPAFPLMIIVLLAIGIGANTARVGWVCRDWYSGAGSSWRRWA